MDAVFLEILKRIKSALHDKRTAFWAVAVSICICAAETR